MKKRMVLYTAVSVLVLMFTSELHPLMFVYVIRTCIFGSCLLYLKPCLLQQVPGTFMPVSIGGGWATVAN